MSVKSRTTCEAQAPWDRVPAPGQAETIAAQLRARALGERARHTPLRDLSELCNAIGLSVRKCSLGGAKGQTEAILIPLPANRFRACIDPEPRGGQSGSTRSGAATRRHRFRFRLCHEIAHTFFYLRRAGFVPVRWLPDSDEQERFADEFAGELLVPSAAARALAPTARSCVALQQRFDVSLEVAVRSLARVHPDAAFGLWRWRTGALDSGPVLQWQSEGATFGPADAVEAQSSPDGTQSVWCPGRRQLVLSRGLKLSGRDQQP
jgi:hypothetical protein